MPTTVFFDNDQVASGTFVGDYVWSDGANWNNGVPANGYDAVIAANAVDDVLGLNLASLTIGNSAEVDVAANTLATGALSLQGSLFANAALAGAPVEVVVNAISGAATGSTLGAEGAGSSLFDYAATDPGLNYLASAGGLVELASAPSDQSTFIFNQGTFAFGAGPGTFNAAFGNVAGGDVFEVAGSSVTSVVIGNTSLSITTDSGTFDFTNVNYSSAVGAVTSAIDPTTGLEEIRLACYCAGTAILTERGEVAVEDLRAGDLVRTASGALRPIRWIGQRSYSGRFLRNNPAVLPIRICAGALGDGLPRRDLRVSPAHAMHLDGLLVAASALVNDATILHDTGLDRVDYFHVELDDHDVILAEGAASETYLEDGDRAVFANHAECPDRLGATQRAKPRYCAPRVSSGHAVMAIRRRLAPAHARSAA